MKKLLFAGMSCVMVLPCFAGTPLFTITPNFTLQSSLINGQAGTAVYQVTNNTPYTLSTIGLARMAPGIVPNTNSVSAYSQYCSNPFSLAPGASCLLKLQLNTSQLGSSVSGGPIVCYPQSNPVYCSQPLTPDQLTTTISQSAQPQDCNSNVANFNYELTQNLDNPTSGFSSVWGPARVPPALSPSNPNLTNCPMTAGITWEQNRVIAAAAYWISQKLNYCHHYNPDWATPVSARGAGGSAGGYCNPAVDTMPGSVYYGQQARWNYSGKGGETLQNWVGNNRMWYGMDCTNYTAFLYEFAFGTNTTLGIPFNSNTGFQAGQSQAGCTGTSPNICPQDGLSPNIQNNGTFGFANKYLDNPSRAGFLVCMDGTIDANSGPNSPATPVPTMCAGHGGYLSSINAKNKFDQPAVTLNTLVPNGTPILQPGDILYIAGAGPDHQDQPDGSSSSIATHGIIWTGLQVGYGPNNINPALVAPDDGPCADQSIWQPTIGAWLITDSHYQGADYRVLTQCFYLNDLWGVRRVIT